jgi:hypothetical protein
LTLEAPDENETTAMFFHFKRVSSKQQRRFAISNVFRPNFSVVLPFQRCFAKTSAQF